MGSVGRSGLHPPALHPPIERGPADAEPPRCLSLIALAGSQSLLEDVDLVTPAGPILCPTTGHWAGGARYWVSWPETEWRSASP